MGKRKPPIVPALSPPPEDAPARARVEGEVRDLMTSGAWRGGKSHHELASKHAVSWHYVKRIAGEVGRELRRMFHGASEDERDAAVGRILARMEETRDMAISRTRVWYNHDGEPIESANPDYRAAIEIDKLELTMLGKLVQKHEHKQVDDVTEEQFREELRKYLTETESEGKDGMH